MKNVGIAVFIENGSILIAYYLNDRILNVARTTVCANKKIRIGSYLMFVLYSAVKNSRVELSFCAKSYVIVVIGRPPGSCTAVIYRARTLRNKESRCKLIAVANIILVSVTEIPEACVICSAKSSSYCHYAAEYVT